MVALQRGVRQLRRSRGIGVMALTSKLRPSRLKFHPDAYRFVFEALQYSQEHMKKDSQDADEESCAHQRARVADRRA